MKKNEQGLYESEDKMVSHPGHYQSSTGLEVIDVIKAFTEGLSGIEATDTGNIIKYACRWKDKNGIQDLEKILWYTQHLITHLKDKNAIKEKPKNDQVTEHSQKGKIEREIKHELNNEYGKVNTKANIDNLSEDMFINNNISKSYKPGDVYNPPIVGCVGKTDVVDIFIAYGDMIKFVKSLGPKHVLLDEIKWIKRNPEGNIIRLPIEVAIELGYIDTTFKKYSMINSQKIQIL